MGRKLSDKEISKLLTDVIRDGTEALLNPNGIELRLGNRVRFLSTSEEKEVPPEHCIKVRPGEMVMVNSLEILDFSKETVQRHFPGCMLMAWITPTTTMVREGILNAATKVDAGFCGQLNWGFRNSSLKDLVLENGESIFKLTLELLEGAEIPERVYGSREKDKYQNTSGVLKSRRKVFADIPKDRIISSDVEKIDPKKQLSEAGYPFNYISTELIQLDGKFEMVSSNVSSLSKKIEDETASVVNKIEESKKWTVEHIDSIFIKKFFGVTGQLFGGLLMFYAVYQLLVKKFAPTGDVLFTGLLIAGFVIIAITWFVTRSSSAK
jgi:deoxycytidine triphosphate deaminase